VLVLGKKSSYWGVSDSINPPHQSTSALLTNNLLPPCIKHYICGTLQNNERANSWSSNTISLIELLHFMQHCLKGTVIKGSGPEIKGIRKRSHSLLMTEFWGLSTQGPMKGTESVGKLEADHQRRVSAVFEEKSRSVTPFEVEK